MYEFGEYLLAKAVLEQAEDDAANLKDGYHKRDAINFLCGIGKKRREWLENWATLARKNPQAIIDENRKKWRPELCKKYNSR